MELLWSRPNATLFFAPDRIESRQNTVMCNLERLKTELETYEREKSKLVMESEGKYVLIHGNQIAGIWDTYQDALSAGYSAFGLEPFLVKQIRGIEQVQFFTRDLAPCPS